MSPLYPTMTTAPVDVFGCVTMCSSFLFLLFSLTNHDSAPNQLKSMMRKVGQNPYYKFMI